MRTRRNGDLFMAFANRPHTTSEYVSRIFREASHFDRRTLSRFGLLAPDMVIAGIHRNHLPVGCLVAIGDRHFPQVDSERTLGGGVQFYFGGTSLRDWSCGRDGHCSTARSEVVTQSMKDLHGRARSAAGGNPGNL